VGGGEGRGDAEKEMALSPREPTEKKKSQDFYIKKVLAGGEGSVGGGKRGGSQ